MATGRIDINATADQSIKLDIRPAGKMNVNLSNGANIFFSLYNVFTDGSTGTINLQNGLEDGVILFDKDMVESGLEFDEELKSYKIVIKKSSKTQTITITAVEGVDIGKLTWSDTLNDGYWTLTGMVAVPEPAEWAMIFGGIVLGLAIYRRRK